MSVLIPACVSCPQHAEALECTAPVCCSSASLVSQSLLGPPTRPDMAQAEYKRHTTQAWSPNSCFCSKTNPVIVFAQKLSYIPGNVLTFFHIRVFNLYAKVSQSLKIIKKNKFGFLWSKCSLLNFFISLRVDVKMRPPRFELHTVEGFKKHKCETFIVRLQFYGTFYCPSALGTAASD